MDILQGVYLLLVGFGAGFVQRVTGFGLGIVAMMFLPHFLPNHTAAAAISSLLSCVATTYNAIRYRKNAAHKLALPMICAALITIPIAVHFSSVVSGHIFKILLGVALILLSLYFVFFNKNFKIKPNILNGVLAGTLGGTLSGLFSTGGPPAVLYISSAIDDNLTYFVTIQFYFCFTDLYGTTMRIVDGILTLDILVLAVIGMVGCLCGNYLGSILFNKLDSKKLKYIIYIGMLISGVVMFF